MRNLSFFLTQDQFRARTKTVTRRKGTWWSTVLKPGTLLCGVEKAQGVKKGGLVRMGTIRVVSVDVERLWPCGSVLESAREGFPEMTWAEFAQMFCKHMGGDLDQIVTRIEFEYVDEALT